MSETTRGLLLCGGYGRRLWPYTTWMPKALMPVLDKPLLIYTIERFRQAGITEIAVNSLNNIAELRHCLGDGSDLGVRITYFPEPFQLGTGGILHHIADFWGDSTLVVSVGDMVSTVDLADMIDFHRGHRAAATVACLEHPWALEEFGGDVAVLEPGTTRVAEYQWKPLGAAKSRLASSGTWIFEPRVRPVIPEPIDASAIPEAVDLNRDVMPTLTVAPDLGLHAFVSAHDFEDFGLPERFIEGSLRSLSGDFGILPHMEKNPDGNYIHATADLAADVVLEGVVLVDRDAVLAEGVHIVGPCVIGAGSVIEAGAVVRESVVLPGARIGRDSVVLHSLIGDSLRTTEAVKDYYWSGSSRPQAKR
ncbi:sugar phosphate nucleotidyltransferase [Streptomyces goshikiensis]|uniref:sugar phosphate nucleotidyltransferase n=1 Tax=Streptomyces goshikiensis TaxID=1942 RepID=UPI0036F8DE7A